MHQHDIYMRRALELAALGAGAVSPNPMVGCVIVHGQRIIGEGWHRAYGGPHAEPNAINAVVDKSLLKESTLYVTLEPCSHFGKTPPCADLIIKHDIPRVVIATQDPFEKVNGSGTERLRAAGIHVTAGVLEKEARELNKRFFTFHQKKRPYIILKSAQSSNGCVAAADKKPVKITDAFSDMLSHRMRAHEDAIMVGSETARHDNPSLSTRHFPGRHPLRCVIDRQLTLPLTLSLFTDGGQTWVFNEIKNEDGENTEYIKIDSGADALSSIIKQLHLRNILSLVVEGGPTLHRLFLMANLWDEAFIFESNSPIINGIAGAVIPQLPTANYPLLSNRLSVFRNE